MPSPSVKRRRRIKKALSLSNIFEKIEAVLPLPNALKEQIQEVKERIVESTEKPAEVDENIDDNREILVTLEDEEQEVVPDTSKEVKPIQRKKTSKKRTTRRTRN
jgi:hypothetical protein